MSLSAVLYALSDQIRLQIIKNLAEAGEQSCSAVNVPIPKSTLSHHFKVLRESGVIHTRIEGTQRFISLRQEDLDSRFLGLLQIVLQADEPL
ncbi:ArsR/SmtB family transcription factor [Bacillus paralicheniformis]|uniref:ArsR/SmtB family transcription factor n=1 Tax=Bacillus paralicheniformis TaxID=1648923 RepID=UPI002E1D3EAF|nr:helix-turn-helix domain-containing protein [Bacillus paralicheniformis]